MCLAIPGKIIKIGKNHQADIDFGGVIRSAQLDFLPQSKKGDYVIVHAGFAIHKLDKKDAKETINLLKETFGDIKSIV
ncbi:MAG: HypC/HybG/HupF family hydrogenase formation chaperone [Elusimicrobia bacterium]|nr:HypC/HybG/HupF family hydrogenase formation chaperone [Elusimicrobiota bacterium]